MISYPASHTISNDMTIKIKDESGCNELNIFATVEEINGHEVWRLEFPRNKTFFIMRSNGQWRSIGKFIISYYLLNEIGLKLHPLAIINTLNLSALGE